MKEQYEQIAQSLINSIEEKWKKILLDVTINPVDGSKKIISSYSLDGSHYLTYMLDDLNLNNISEAIDVLQKQTNDRGKGYFSGLILSLDEEQNFEVKFFYPDKLS